ncbi:MAG: hypothetical protein CMM01_00360 [Rhodopirellula sp.]|nr:hypothetical protein [Rhodopirellula sp.]
MLTQNPVPRRPPWQHETNNTAVCRKNLLAGLRFPPTPSSVGNVSDAFKAVAILASADHDNVVDKWLQSPEPATQHKPNRRRLRPNHINPTCRKQLFAKNRP